MKFKRTFSAASLAFYGLKTIFPVILLLRLLNNIIMILFPEILPEDEMINASDATAPFLLLVLGGIWAYRLTGIAAANSAGKKTVSAGVIMAAVPVSALFAAIDLLTVKFCIAGIYGKPAVYFLEPAPTGYYYTSDSVCGITDVKEMLFLFGATVLIYFWALLAGYVIGLFITHRCKIRITLAVMTAVLSIVLYYVMLLSENGYWGIGILAAALINPVVFVYSSLTLISWAILSESHLALIIASMCFISLITLVCNMLSVKRNIPTYRNRRKR